MTGNEGRERDGESKTGVVVVYSWNLHTYYGIAEMEDEGSQQILAFRDHGCPQQIS